MNVGIYQGATALAALDRWQEVVAQNIANSSVPGYKASEMSVEGENYGTIQDRTGVRSSTQPAVMPINSVQTSFEPGSASRTGNPTDVSIGSNGFFVIQQGNGNMLYTRNGQFNTNASNQLINANGDLVQGVGGPIQLLSGREVSINQLGQIYQGNQLVGKLQVMNFSDTSKLTKVSGGFQASDDAAPTPDTNPNISQGYLEGSNVSGMGEMIKLIEATHAQEANQKVIQAYDNRMGKVIQTFTR